MIWQGFVPRRRQAGWKWQALPPWLRKALPAREFLQKYFLIQKFDLPLKCRIKAEKLFIWSTKQRPKVLGRSPFLLSNSCHCFHHYFKASCSPLWQIYRRPLRLWEYQPISVVFPSSHPTQSTSIRVVAGCGLARSRGSWSSRSSSVDLALLTIQATSLIQRDPSFIAISISRRYVSYLPNKFAYFLPPHGQYGHNLATRAFGHELLSKLLLFFFSGKGDKYLMRLIWTALVS